MLRGELPLSSEGTKRQAKSCSWQQALCLPWEDLCSASRWEDCTWQPQSERVAEVLALGKGMLGETEGSAGTLGYFAETQQDHLKSCQALFWRKWRKISISSWRTTREGNYLHTYIFFLENMFFSSNHTDMHLQESKVTWNTSSSASRNLPGSIEINGVAHISTYLASDT